MFKSIYNFFHRNYYKRYYGQYAHAKKLFVIDIFLFAVTFVMFFSTIYFLYWNPGLTDQIDLKVSLGDGRVKSGELVKVTVDYTNRSKYNLRNAILALHLPENFIIDRSQTATTTFKEDSTFDLQTLRPGAVGQAVVYGYLWVPPKQENKITALLSYLPENSQNREQKIGIALITLPDSLLQTSLDVVTTSFAGNKLPFVFKIKNTGNFEIDNLKFDINFIGGVNTKDNLQNINLAKDEEKTINGEITMPHKTGQYDLTVDTIYNINNHSVSILKSNTTIKTFSPEIGIAASLKDDATFAEPKQILNASLKWQNYGQFELNNQAIHIAFTPGIVDIKTTAKENGFETDGKNLIITAKERTALANGTAQANDEFGFKIYLLPTFALNGIENAQLQIIPSFEAELKSLPGQKFITFGANAQIPLATEMSLSSEARYYSDEGDQLGRGPLPVQIGETTKYWIFIRVNNTTNAVDNAVFSAKLPANITFTGKQSVTIGPSVAYNENTGDLNWKFYSLPANSQTGLYLEVAVTPTPDQIGKTIELLSDLKFSATDKTTGKQFFLTKPTVTNILPPTDLGSKK